MAHGEEAVMYLRIGLILTALSNITPNEKFRDSVEAGVPRILGGTLVRQARPRYARYLRGSS
jgi:hypothetical protein